MKRVPAFLLAILFSAALMQLYYAHRELQNTCETLAYEVKCETDLLTGTIAVCNERTRRDTRKIAELEAKLQALTAEKSRNN